MSAFGMILQLIGILEELDVIVGSKYLHAFKNHVVDRHIRLMTQQDIKSGNASVLILV